MPEWRTWTYTLFAAAAGWMVGVQGWPVALLLALPLGDVIGSRWEGRKAVPATKAMQNQVIRLRGQLADADEVAATARRRANSATAGLVTAANLAVNLEEDVRAVIVADLHDTVAQTLVAASYLGMNPETPTDRLAVLAAEAEAQLREIMTSRRPLGNTSDSFADSMAALVADLELRFGLQVEVQWPDQQVLMPRATSVVLYRFTAEALTNVAKHARTGQAWVELAAGDDTLTMTVRDSGSGFDTADLATTARLGLTLVQRRAEMVGGYVETQSTPGSGTTVRCVVPMVVSLDAASTARPTSAAGTARP